MALAEVAQTILVYTIGGLALVIALAALFILTVVIVVARKAKRGFRNERV